MAEEKTRHIGPAKEGFSDLDMPTNSDAIKIIHSVPVKPLKDSFSEIHAIKHSFENFKVSKYFTC